MEYITYRKDEDRLTVSVKGHIDSANAPAVEKEINEAISLEKPARLSIDAADLTYISSAGLRVILRLRKEFRDLSIVNVSPEV